MYSIDGSNVPTESQTESSAEAFAYPAAHKKPFQETHSPTFCTTYLQPVPTAVHGSIEPAFTTSKLAATSRSHLSAIWKAAKVPDFTADTSTCNSTDIAAVFATVCATIIAAKFSTDMSAIVAT
jgi:hypothetical protein